MAAVFLEGFVGRASKILEILEFLENRACLSYVPIAPLDCWHQCGLVRVLKFNGIRGNRELCEPEVHFWS